jgi:hypothetical protein
MENEFPQLPPTQRLKKSADNLRVESAFLRMDSRTYVAANENAAKVLEHAAKKILSAANSVEKLTAIVWDE